jgi:hypothetical protein
MLLGSIPAARSVVAQRTVAPAAALNPIPRRLVVTAFRHRMAGGAPGQFGPCGTQRHRRGERVTCPIVGDG